MIAALTLGELACARSGVVADPQTLGAIERKQAARAGPGFESAVVRPFVIMSNGSRAMKDAEHTVTWVRDALRADFFPTEPGPTTIWIFRDTPSYVGGMAALGEPIMGAPFYTYTQASVLTASRGHYNPYYDEIFVNFGHGRRVLIHEMVHAYLRADCPEAAVWVDEGMASFFELAELDGAGHIRGAPSMARLAVLKDYLARREVPSFERMAHAGYFEFHGDREHVFYPMAVYVFHWLQKHDLFSRFYREYRSHVREDPAGLTVLRQLTNRDLSDFRVEWERYVRESWENLWASAKARSAAPAHDRGRYVSP
jgi:hypothetical protein